MSSNIELSSVDPSFVVFDEVFNLRAAEEQATKNKTSVFGMHKYNPLGRPTDENVSLAKSELRYDPFWHVEVRRTVDYLYKTTYTVGVSSHNVQEVEIEGQMFDVEGGTAMPQFDLPAVERSRLVSDSLIFRDALVRRTQAGKFQDYIQRYDYLEPETLDLPGAVVAQITLPSLIEEARRELVGASEGLRAHEITGDRMEVRRAALCYRPVFVFEFKWERPGEDKVGVLEIDGLTGEQEAKGEWLRDKLERVMTRDMLFDVGAEIANATVPVVGGATVKALRRMTDDDSSR